MRKLIFITLSLLLLSLVNAAEFPATFSFTTSPMIVYDVPFLVNLNVETAGQSYIDYDLTVQGTNNIEEMTLLLILIYQKLMELFIE
jgi:hypothetical protein